MGERKVDDYSFLAFGTGTDPKTGEKIPGFVGLALKWNDGTVKKWGLIYGKNRQKIDQTIAREFLLEDSSTLK